MAVVTVASHQRSSLSRGEYGEFKVGSLRRIQGQVGPHKQLTMVLPVPIGYGLSSLVWHGCVFAGFPGGAQAAFMYPLSVDNKARYCAAHGCTLVVGGRVPEAAGRSARWLKVKRSS